MHMKLTLAEIIPKEANKFMEKEKSETSESED